jgi:5-formyltetrahydrofolate cyclo-ligase
LSSGAFCLLEPTGPAVATERLRDAAAVVVPALAVDRAGHRLGRGGGFYDRALAAVEIPTVAVVFDDELMDELPVEPHDVPVGAVLTPRGGVRPLPLS